jgi:hypothetical protein
LAAPNCAHPDSPISAALIVNQIGDRRFGELIVSFIQSAAYE